VAGGVSHPKSPISSARDQYCPPTDTVVGGREGSVVGEVDVVVLVLVCGDEKIELGVGF
jgi:hypothetical protein